jgi:CRISPR-associated protein Csm4
MKTYAVYLKPKGSILGEISSDTIFGAFCWAIFNLYSAKELEEVLSKFNEEPKFLISSPFPYLRNSENKIRFFPKPKFPAPSFKFLEGLAKKETKNNNSLNFKRAWLSVKEIFEEIKNTLFLSEQIFYKVVSGKLSLPDIFRNLKSIGYLENDLEKIEKAIISHPERKSVDPQGELLFHFLMRAIDIQRNQINRLSGTTAEGLLFFSSQTFFIKKWNGLESGLWFLLKTNDFDFVKPLFNYIADTGLGGDRTVGKGHFDIEWEEISEMVEVKEPNCFINLSRYIPNPNEIDVSKIPLSYIFKNIRGKHESKFIFHPNQPYLKKLVRVFEEGSIFPFIEKKPFYGKLVLVGEKEEIGRNVYQNGVTIPIFAKMEVKYEI